MTYPQRRAFSTLDGLRGIAALLVISRHAGYLSNSVSFPESFLAVDLFFLLSGFVIAYAYDDRLARPGNLLNFLGIRLIRLYPLYLLGLVIGLVHRVGSALAGTSGWTMDRVAEALLLGLLLIPKTSYTSVGSTALDGPTWTLLPELLANMAYAACHRWLNRSALAVIVALGAAGVVGCRLSLGTLDAGWDLSQWPITLSRLVFSFFGGALLFRLLRDRRRVRPWLAWSCIAVVAAALVVTPPEPLRAAYELVLVLVVFPVVVCIACISEPGRRSGVLFRFFGLISYAVYVLHEPAAELTVRLLQRGTHLDLSVPAVANLSLAGFVALLVGATWMIDRYYDAPTRRWLSRHWRRDGRLAGTSTMPPTASD